MLNFNQINIRNHLIYEIISYIISLSNNEREENKMNTIELVKQASTQNVHGREKMKLYLQFVSKTISSTKMTDICDYIYSQYLIFKGDKKQFNELSLFLNLELDKL